MVGLWLDLGLEELCRLCQDEKARKNGVKCDWINWPWWPHCHMAVMGPHSRQQSIQQSTNRICNESASLKLEKNIFITINMTIIARPLMSTMQGRWYNNGTMSTVQPARWIRHCRCRVDARMCVDGKERQGGAGREKWGSNGDWQVIMCRLIVQLGSQVFFWQRDAQQLVHNNS